MKSKKGQIPRFAKILLILAALIVIIIALIKIAGILSSYVK